MHRDPECRTRRLTQCRLGYALWQFDSRQRAAIRELSVRNNMSAAPIIDPILGSITDDGDAWFAATLVYNEQPIQIFLPDDGACVDPSALHSARNIAQHLASTVESALAFLATFPGFGDLMRVRQIFSLQGIVTTSKADFFWLEFRCSEDRNPEAIWRVEFQGGVPTAHGRDD